MNLDQQIAAVAREIAMREGVYPKWVAAGKMKQEKADHELAAMKQVIATLNALKALEPLEAKASLTPWKDGSGDTREADTVYHEVRAGNGKVIFDSCNSEDMRLEGEADEGRYIWRDEIAKGNFKLICAARNALQQIFRPAAPKLDPAAAWPFPKGPMP